MQLSGVKNIQRRVSQLSGPWLCLFLLLRLSFLSLARSAPELNVSTPGKFESTVGGLPGGRETERGWGGGLVEVVVEGMESSTLVRKDTREGRARQGCCSLPSAAVVVRSFSRKARGGTVLRLNSDVVIQLCQSALLMLSVLYRVFLPLSLFI